MVFLCKELRIAVLEYQLYFHPDGEKYHGHVKYREYAFSLVLAFKLSLYLCNLYKEELLMIGI